LREMASVVPVRGMLCDELRSDAAPSLRLQAQLPPLLSVIAGAVDLLGYFLLGHIFAAHITGNLVLVAASLVHDGPWSPAQVLTIPVFIVALVTVWGYARVSGARELRLTYHLVVIQFCLLFIVFASAVAFHPSAHPRSRITLVTAMLMVSAMATQYALFPLAMPKTVPTGVMTGNLIRVVLSLIDTVSKGSPLIKNEAEQVRTSLPLLIGFLVGCILAAAAISTLGDWALLVPVLLGAVAIILVAANNGSPTLRESINRT
jgi:uncharacterized membrane protein YoaK (UPF0700 family)